MRNPAHTDSRERRGCGCGSFVLLGLGLVAALAVLVLALQRRVETHVDIDAPPDRVWTHVIDFEGYARWNPYLATMSGDAEVGAQLRATVVVGELDPFELTATVDVAREGEELRWSGGLFLPWLLDEEHYVRLVPTDRGGCRVTHGVRLRGLVPALLWGKIEAPLEDGLRAHNAKLKSKSEGG